MDRRRLIQKTAGMLLFSSIVGKKLLGAEAGAHDSAPRSTTPTADESQLDDWHSELSGRIATLDEKGGGTLELGDGVYELSKPLRLPVSVSLTMTPNAVLRAKAGFSGDAVLIKGGGSKSKFTDTSGWIRGGVIDGGLQPVTGIRVEAVQRFEIADLVVANATYKGIHLLRGGYEKNITRVRCEVALSAHYAPGSIGIHYENGDSKVILAHVIGYETGVRSDDSSNWFTTIHVWNYDVAQGPMLYCFYCNGDNNTFAQCYADSPTIAGFYINKPYQSLLQCRVYYSRWAKDNSGVGFLITPEGKCGNYIGNVLFANPAHRLAKAFDGDLEGACILGTTTTGGVMGGLQNRIPSGDMTTPPLKLDGTGFCLTRQKEPPAPTMGEVGEIRWVDDGASSALWVKTSTGWRRSELK
ncbi:MAG: hypothetical protein ACLP07_03790 [Terracidiphilus sp.]